MTPLKTILLLLLGLCGCAPYGRVIQSQKMPPPLPVMAAVASHPLVISQVASHKTDSMSQNQAADTLATVQNGSHTLTWEWEALFADADGNWMDGDDYVCFKIYSTTDLSQSVTNWPLYLTVDGTNRTVTLPNDSPQRYFVVTTSNLNTGLESGYAVTGKL